MDPVRNLQNEYSAKREERIAPSFSLAQRSPKETLCVSTGQVAYNHLEPTRPVRSPGLRSGFGRRTARDFTNVNF